jgi:hypothetical protein
MVIPHQVLQFILVEVVALEVLVRAQVVVQATEE